MPEKLPRQVVDAFLFKVATSVVSQVAGGVGSIDDMIAAALRATHKVDGIVLDGPDLQPVIYQDSEWRIPDSRRDQFTLLCAYIDAHFVDEETHVLAIRIDNPTNLIGRAEAWGLRLAGHGRQAGTPPRKRKLADT